MDLTYQLVKNDQQINSFIKATEKYLERLGFTDHGFRHLTIVADRSKKLARQLGLTPKEQELAAVAGYCHDLGNFMGREMHHYWSALIFFQIMQPRIKQTADLVTIMQAIVNHDSNHLQTDNKIAAVLVLADKSDVHRSRVRQKDLTKIKEDIHDRVNYAVTDNDLLIDKRTKEIILKLTIDTTEVEPINYFQIFIDRMTQCQQAAEILGYKFVLIINNFRF
ncbi:MAG TPA: HD domain-containing protein [bacterium]|nr:HD domain-containing protein [bacterium]